MRPIKPENRVKRRIKELRKIFEAVDADKLKPVDPPEPVFSDEETRAIKANAIAARYSSQVTELKDAMVTAQLSGDTDLAKSLTDEYKATMNAYSKELEELK